MAFDFSKLSFIPQYLTSNTWVLADIAFVVYGLYNIIMHFNIGLVGTLFRFIGYILAYFISRFLTYQATIYLGLRDQSSILIVAVVLFILFSYILYKQLKYITPGPVSFFDSLIGAFYGICESLFFLLVLNTTCIYVNQNGFGIPDWVLVANGIKTEKSVSNLEKPEIIYSLIKLGKEKTIVVLPVDKVGMVFDWIKSQFSSMVIDMNSAADKAKQAAPSKITTTSNNVT